MHRFEYRNPRFPVDFPAQFYTANKTLAGRCTDIGIKGMRLDLPDMSYPAAKGWSLCIIKTGAIELKARVARIGSTHCGLEFICDSHAEQSAVAHLLAKLTAPHSRHLISLVSRVDASLGGPAPRGPNWTTARCSTT